MWPAKCDLKSAKRILGRRLGVGVSNPDVRSGMLQSLDVIKAAALDPYTFVRDGYLQKRENDVYDGNPPSDFDYTDSERP